MVIGVLDLLVAFFLLTLQSRFAVGYMAAWGLVTASSRTTAFGFDAWPETLLRAANGGVPIAIMIYWWPLRGRNVARQEPSCELDKPELLTDGDE